MSAWGQTETRAHRRGMSGRSRHPSDLPLCAKSGRSARFWRNADTPNNGRRPDRSAELLSLLVEAWVELGDNAEILGTGQELS